MAEDTQDLKDGIAPDSIGQEETKQETSKDDSEDISTLPSWAQDRVKKLEEEKENYKKGMLKAKGKEKSLTPEVEANVLKTEEEAPNWDDNSKKFQTETLSKAEEVAKAQAMKAVESSNERSAINDFLDSHPEFVNDDVKWSELVANYAPKNGKGTVSGIKKDLERALKISLVDSGELEQAATLAKKQGYAEGFHADSMTSRTSAPKSSNSNETEEVSEGARALAKAMGVDPKKLGNETPVSIVNR